MKMEVTSDESGERYISIAYEGDYNQDAIAKPCIDAIENELLKHGYKKRTAIVQGIAETNGTGKGRNYVECWGVR